MVVAAVLWGGPEDGKEVVLSDLCFELELTGLGTPIMELPSDIVPTYIIKYEKTDAVDRTGKSVYRYVKWQG